MNTAKEIRANILKILFKVNDVKTLKSIYQELKVIYKASSSKNEIQPAFMKAVKPIRKGVTLDEMILEQNYRPITYKNFRNKVKSIEWEESLEELLEALSK